MEDKTIIDGIDINKCQHYTGNVEYLSREWTCRAETIGAKCEENPNCYFKQLARAKEENEKLKVQIKNEKQALQIDIDNFNQACLDLSQENDDLHNKLQAKEQECEELKKLVQEAEKAPICFHCSEEPCIRQERDKYKKLSVDFKDVNKQLGYKYITLKQALDAIEKFMIYEFSGQNQWVKKNVLDIINKAKEQ